MKLSENIEKILDTQRQLAVLWEELPNAWGAVYYSPLSEGYWWQFEHTHSPRISTASGAAHYTTLDDALDALDTEREAWRKDIG